jgi:hypothetical protein
LTSLNLSANKLGAAVVPKGWSRGFHGDYSNYTDSDGVVFWKHTDGRQQIDSPRKVEGIGALVNAIKDMGALTSVSTDGFPRIEGEEICQMVCMNKLNIALRDKSLTELDVSGIGFGAEGTKVVAQYISDNPALTHLDISGNNLTQGGLDFGNQWGRSGFSKWDSHPFYKKNMSGI